MISQSVGRDVYVETLLVLSNQSTYRHHFQGHIYCSYISGCHDIDRYDCSGRLCLRDEKRGENITRIFKVNSRV